MVTLACTIHGHTGYVEDCVWCRAATASLRACTTPFCPSCGSVNTTDRQETRADGLTATLRDCRDCNTETEIDVEDPSDA